jgi:uncharacterized membrane protein YhaH (DUF805 family)
LTAGDDVPVSSSEVDYAIRESAGLSMMATTALVLGILSIPAARVVTFSERMYGVYCKREMAGIIALGGLATFVLVVASVWTAIACLVRRRHAVSPAPGMSRSILALTCVFVSLYYDSTRMEIPTVVTRTGTGNP